ncbi:Lrp/AsnC family transcriptional regulator [Alcaligenaceae bacterium 429]|uniref:Lrp/AsnC family transcriptional regulator n=1 Tax=Paenalcaligenes sp. Me52 TaxID=3392038 RepID=UPI001092B207|nr:Lrp/AsnC family transcriptional regulator [Alcaligenaceae bacterium 429]
MNAFRYPELDSLDRQLIAALQINARESVASLARTLGVARTTILSRIQRLEKQGVIHGYTVQLAAPFHEQGLQAYAGIIVKPKLGNQVLRQLSQIPEVESAATVSGEFDLMIWLRARSTEELDLLLDTIGALEGVVRTHSAIVLARKFDRRHQHR